ncbi:Restriction endonuclease, type II-like superfamily protein [Quillaja saponaria]|nr:Restriction endonuclease, type II-like superfamily protein [Quillaja saponaria]
MNGMTVSATRFCGLCLKAFTCTRRNCGNGILRNFLTCTAPLISSASPLSRYPSSSIVSASNISPSDTPQLSDEWFALRRDRLIMSTFSTALGFWKGNRRFELWREKVFVSNIQIVDSAKKNAMQWGVLREAAAIDRYKSITGHEVSSLGFATHSKERFDWLGASPDGLVGCFPGGGILEVKCSYNKRKPEMGLPWSTMPFYYILRERSYWDLIHGILREFWWENVVPAREALLLVEEDSAKSYKPTSVHKQTGLAIVKSMKLASEAKLLCREIAGQVEAYR